MNDKTLLKVAVVWSLIGILALLFLSEYTEPDNVKIMELAEHMG